MRKLWSGSILLISFKSGTVFNREASAVTIPSLLKQVTNDKGEVEYRWKVNIIDTKPYWVEWFKGMSNAFNSLKLPKLLLVSSMDRLDVPLAIGHMQGKFKLEVIKGTGHFIQEDRPEEVASSIRNLISFFGIAESTK